MNRLIATCAAALFALAAVPAFSADLTPDERSELRERANALNTKRQSNPSWDGATLYSARSDIPLDRPQGDLKTPKNRGEVKAKPSRTRKAKPEPTRKKMENAASSVPGALLPKEHRR